MRSLALGLWHRIDMVYNLVCSCEMVVAAFFDVYSAVVTAVIHK
jgi:hypothetical protein